MKDPCISMCVYASDGQDVSVEVCDAASNPIKVQVGSRGYPFHQLLLFLGPQEAERLHTQLGFMLQELQRRAHPETCCDGSEVLQIDD